MTFEYKVRHIKMSIKRDSFFNTASDFFFFAELLQFFTCNGSSSQNQTQEERSGWDGYG